MWGYGNLVAEAPEATVGNAGMGDLKIWGFGNEKFGNKTRHFDRLSDRLA
jgi:hypothetical protein